MTPLDRERLAQVLGMLGSHHDGEIANAGRRAHRLIREAGLTWREPLDDSGAVDAARALLTENKRLCDELAQLSNRPRLLPGQEPQDLDETLLPCVLWRNRLAAWEQNFIDSGQYCRRPSDRQWRVIWDITRKIVRMARAGA